HAASTSACDVQKNGATSGPTKPATPEVSNAPWVNDVEMGPLASAPLAGRLVALSVVRSNWMTMGVNVLGTGSSAPARICSCVSAEMTSVPMLPEAEYVAGNAGPNEAPTTARSTEF